MQAGIAVAIKTLADRFEPLQQVYKTFTDDAVRAEELGFDFVSTSEHHFEDDAWSPSQLVILSNIAERPASDAREGRRLHPLLVRLPGERWRDAGRDRPPDDRTVREGDPPHAQDLGPRADDQSRRGLNVSGPGATLLSGVAGSVPCTTPPNL
jgi:hypothetical protein